MVSILSSRPRGWRLSSSLVMAVANICEMAFPLVRGVILARILTPAQFGLAITVTVVAGVAELVTDLGVAQLALRIGSPKTLPSLHSVALVRGAMLAAFVAACGPLFERVFHTGGTAWAYIFIGLALLIRSFGNLEVKVRMRRYDFLGESCAIIASQVSWTVVSVLLALALHDYRAMTFGVLAAALAFTASTHLTSADRWRLGWDRVVVKEALTYGRALAANGVAFALVSLGDRTLTAAKIGLSELAQYTALATSAFVPRSAILRFLNSVFTPHFVNAETPEEQRKVADAWVTLMSLISGVFGLGYIAVGQAATSLVFGAAYHPSQRLVSLVGLLGAVRYMAGLPGPPALAKGQNGLLLQLTLFSVLGLALGAGLLTWHPWLELLVGGMAVGEMLALFYTVYRMNRTMHLDTVAIWTGVTIPLACVVATAVVASTVESPTARIGACLICLCIEVGLAAMLLRRAGYSFAQFALMVFPKRKTASST